MSEKTIAQAAAETLWDLDAELKAAEERGRRSGVEKAQRLVYAVMAEWPGSYDGLNCVLQRLKSLAPRDSGPVSDCPLVGCQIIGKHQHPIGGPSEARK